MRYLLRSMAAAWLLASACTAPCLAQSEPGASGAGTVQPAQPSAGEIVIGEVARRILYDYYQRNAQAWIAANPDWNAPDPDGPGDGPGDGDGKNKHKNNGNGHKNGHGGKPLPPGIAKKGALPPGIAKQLARNRPLPTGLVYQELPPALVVQLPPLAPDYRYIIADDRVMLIRAATNVILDVLQVPGV
jgi:hypothetical protein